MLKICKDGEVIALCENPNWVCLQENGCFGLCARDFAEGIAVNGVVYNLPGHDIGGDGTVACEDVDGGEYIIHQQEVSDELILTILEG